MIILAIDTAASLCAACVYDSVAGRELGRAVLDLGKGHAEHVMATVEEALEKAGLTYEALRAIAVSVGPGSFTGVRVGVSAVRGFALALDVPAIGVNTLEALAAEVRETVPERKVLAVTGKRADSLAMGLFDGEGAVLEEPKLVSAGEAGMIAIRAGAVVTGEAADLVAAERKGKLEIAGRAATADIRYYARLASLRGARGGKPTPLYLRAPDAKPQSQFALPLKAR
ncbi:tRNA (adenosine(37)-N6)-threonylcarbamoyltransferase complex dimerization subunit type 1 TsaB [Chelativorans sp. YIM 93263]|uniref:tRNA (adenosine(37)-N6)-threonylcarbamoyltransferase complex dimerization subunit type 1 TsaB n=1 Tax=Chelativorans sp. YIM 93263 TaxID=2906648 RepID=UPI0023790E75|nr:tRNA (adenosine(37)-N6)-threonylcarbamoyltransferase complex dimerization subunit type 1 TsaB [Chelativorans sp. YIM 93263]